MKPQLAYIVFLFLLTSSLAAGIDSMLRAERRAQQSVDLALAMTLRECEPDRIDADTIRVYRSHIALEALRDTAYLSLIVADDSRRSAALRANTGLTIRRLWQLSDQRASGLLAALASLWLAASLIIIRRQRPLLALAAPVPAGLDQLTYDALTHRFVVSGRELNLTPMQHDLLQLFIQAPDHRLPQHVICERLWPKKPDASATLYTLVRRLKQTLAETTDISVECDRGQAYRLTSAGSQVTRP